MTKKEIINLLDKEVGLFLETEDENSLGELYLTKIQFKKAQQVLRELNKKKREEEKWVEMLRKIVEGNKRFIVWKDLREVIKGKTINLPFPLIILDGNPIITGCFFNQKKL